MDPQAVTLVKQRGVGRVLMTPGRGYLWAYGLVPIVIAFCIPILLLPTGNDVRRWVGIVFAVVLVGYLVLAVRWWVARWKRYRTELESRGLRHGRPG